MRKNTLLLLLLLCFIVGSCTTRTTNAGKAEENNRSISTYNVGRYKLFSTQNMWTFIKLDTRTGQMWQIQYSLSDDKTRFECNLNPKSLVTVNDNQVNGRFELYPTTNIYNFILLDQIDGRSWQVQWSFDENDRTLIPIG